jgi:CPA1 family monovalent cation:H+ antiporter
VPEPPLPPLIKPVFISVPPDVRATGAGTAGVPDPIIVFWSRLDRVLNLGLILLIGLQVLALIVTGRELAIAAGAVPLALAARLISVGIPLALSGRSPRAAVQQAAVLTWAGMRGGISIALALTMPVTVFRGQLLIICYSVVLFSIVVQGLTLPGLLARLYPRSSHGGE